MYQSLNNWIVPMALLIGTPLMAQEQDLTFRKLETIGHISEADYQKLYGQPDLKTSDYLVTRWKAQDNGNYLALFAKENGQWTIFRLLEQSGNAGFEVTGDKEFLTYTSEQRSASRGHTEMQTYYSIVDLKEKTQLHFLQSQNEEHWNQTDLTTSGTPDRVERSGCNTQMLFIGKGIFQAIRTATKNEEEAMECLPGGSYKVSDGKLVRTK